MPMPPFHFRFDLLAGTFEGAPFTERRLSDLQGVFADQDAYASTLARDNPVLYTVSALELDQEEGALHCAIGRLMPGRIGREYYMTKGHLHAWRPAAEYYVGLAGEGVMLLEDEITGDSRMVPLLPNSAVYVPGHTAHRTMNTGVIPLVYLGIYPAGAGHDYATIAARNFRHVVVEIEGRPALVERSAYLVSDGKDT
jgi:glucose-6-phosphate isomerase, archaeal